MAKKETKFCEKCKGTGDGLNEDSENTGCPDCEGRGYIEIAPKEDEGVNNG